MSAESKDSGSNAAVVDKPVAMPLSEEWEVVGNIGSYYRYRAIQVYGTVNKAIDML